MIALLIFMFALLFWFRMRLAARFIVMMRRFGCDSQTSIWLYALITLPGVLLHEIAHFLTAALFGLRTGAIALLPMINPDGGVELGSVQVQKCDPFRQSIVGLAPLLFGVPIVVWLSTQLVPLPFSWEMFYRSWGLLFWFKAYLLVTFALHLFPSQKDMAAWPIAGLLLSVFIGAALLMGIRIPSAQLLFLHLEGFINQSIYGVGLAVAVSGCFLCIVEGFVLMLRPRSFRVQ